ncbi:MAG: glycosyl hydrolase, partial [Cardiobacteriaceae bacterium]|nr:glycosyl hydrolase [Cardiobacteriaceae bacterium]
KAYTLQAGDAGKKISVHVEYTDNTGYGEKLDNVLQEVIQSSTDGVTVNLTGAAKVDEGSDAHYHLELDLSPIGKAHSSEALFKMLQDLQGKNILFGQQHAVDEGIHVPDSHGRKSDVHAITGKYPAVFGFDTDENPAENNGTPESNGKAFAKAFTEADTLGAIVTLSSHLRNPVSGKDAFDNQNEVPLSRILPGGDLNHKITDWLDTVATAANHSVRADGTKIPIIFRPLHENTGEWFWWGKGHMSNDDFKALWQYIHSYLTQTKGVDNLLFAYSPNGSLDGNKAGYLATYPGDKYVDIMGYDAYQSDDSKPDAEWIKDTVKDLIMVNQFAAEHNKVSAFTEFGLNNDRVIQPSGNHNIHFFTQLLDAIKADPEASKFAYMLTWSNWGIDENGKFQAYTPYPGHEMEADFKNFVDKLLLAKTTDQDITVDIAVEHGSTSNDDIQSSSSQQVIIPKGETGADFTIKTEQDDKVEGNESYTVKINHVNGANIGIGSTHTEIIDDDKNSGSGQNHSPSDINLSGDGKVQEGQDGITIGKLSTVDEDKTDTHTYSVNDSRFEVTTDGTLKLKAGEKLDYSKEQEITLKITSDDGHSGIFSKDIVLQVQDDPNYPMVKEAPVISLSGTDSVQEGEAASYIIQLDKPSDQPITLNLTLTHINSSAGDFAQAVEKTVTIAAGETSVTLKINTTDDHLPENSERYTLAISNPSGGAKLGEQSSITTTILDNDETAANHSGSVKNSTFAGDRSTENHYFVQAIDSEYLSTYGHLKNYTPGKGIQITYNFATSAKDVDDSDEILPDFRTYSETQKAAIRSVLAHIAEHVDVKFTEGNNPTLYYYLNGMEDKTVGLGVYGGSVHLNSKVYAADDALRTDIPYKIIANNELYRYDGWQTALHETGHSLGLNHPFGNTDVNLSKAEDRDTLTVMSYTPGETIPRVDVGGGYYYTDVPVSQNHLDIYDLAALHYRFGVNPNYHSGDDTYTFKPFSKDAIGNDIYIHDGGGQDIFDASEQTLDLTIDLTPGSWIHAGAKTEHLALNDDLTPTTGQMFIGYGTQIESAKGGTGNDTIKGNSADNYLFGFDGNDHLDGGAGNDQLEGGRGADTLTGGKGKDTFIFASPEDGTADTITDFNFSEGDLLQLAHNIFTALETGVLLADQFVKGKVAQDANDHLLYDRSTGELAYDPDGNGSAVGTVIAKLGIGYELEHNAIHIV